MISRQILFIYKQKGTHTNNTLISGETGGPGEKPLNDQHIDGHETIEKNYDYHIGSHLQKISSMTTTSVAICKKSQV